MRSMHARAAFCGRRVGDKKATSNKTPVNKCISGLVGTICLVGGIVCRWPSILQAATVPLSGVPFGKYVKVGSADYISGHELACQPGSDFCGAHATWNYQTQTCEGANLGFTTMQSFTSSDCNKFTTPIGDGYTQVGVLTDERDGTSYVIRKYADGHCWLAENLKFGRNCTAADFQPSASVTGYVGTYDDYAYKGMCRAVNSNYDGYLYNWEAAMNNSTAIWGVDYDNRANGTSLATHDICPLGWHVPSKNELIAFTGAIHGSYPPYTCWQSECSVLHAFLYTTGSNSWNATDKSTLTGYANGTSLYHLGTKNFWQSSSPGEGSTATTNNIVMSSESDRVYRSGSSYRYGGFTVRCLADY